MACVVRKSKLKSHCKAQCHSILLDQILDRIHRQNTANSEFVPKTSVTFELTCWEHFDVSEMQLRRCEVVVRVRVKGAQSLVLDQIE